ncbi:MAG: hypothetical protein HYT77_02035 [Deltaproteobacteria bacterium]|nr:hypothetical protein [Deltaproteobacteria bacterium]
MRALEFPPFWESLLKRYVKQTFYPGTRHEGHAEGDQFTEKDYRFFAKGIEALNLSFTRERSSLPKNYFNQKEYRSGYLLYFLPVNALKVATLLLQSINGGVEFITSEHDPSSPYTILDIGSGPGTGMLGTFLWLENLLKERGKIPPLRWMLIDQNRHALQDARSLHDEIVAHLRKQGLSIQSELQTIVADLESGYLPRIPAADLMLALNVFSELPRGKRVTLVDRLLYKNPGAVLFLMEPALQRTTRELMELHDVILKAKIGTVLAPCLHQTDCPMLKANRRDWCHTYLEWKRPFYIERFDRLVGIRKDYLKCSYLLLGGGKGSLLYASTYSKETWRVVSGHLNSNGKSEILLCGPGGLPDLLRTTRLDRDCSKVNRVFDEVQRGDLVVMSKTDRIKSETKLGFKP